MIIDNKINKSQEMYIRPGKVKYEKREQMRTRVLFVSGREKKASEE